MSSGQDLQGNQAVDWAEAAWEWIGDFLSHSAFSNLVALASFAVSAYALQKSSPRLKVELSGSLIIDPKLPRWNGKPAEFITVTNYGAAPAYVQRAYLTSRLGGVPAHHVDSQKHDVEEGRSGPVKVAPNGGVEHWIVDRFELRDFAARDAGDTVVNFRAVVDAGGKKLKSRTVEPVHPNEPRQVAQRKPSWRERAKNLVKDLFIPQPFLLSASGWGTRMEDLDLENNRYRIRVKNMGGGFVMGAVLELHALSASGTYRRERVGEPIPLPSLGRKQERLVWVPFAEAEGMDWWIRFNGRVSGQGLGATTRERAEKAIAALDEQNQESNGTS